MIERLKAIQKGRGQFKNQSELSQHLKKEAVRKELKALSAAFLSKEIKGCDNSYMDAYVQLIHLNLEKAMEKEKCKFSLRRGILLHDVVNRDISKAMTQANITNELALYHLKTNPDCAEYFDVLPKNWKSMFNEKKAVKKTK